MILQLKLDETLGQVWTPSKLANEMVREAFSLFPSAKKILDPACGPATFSKAIHLVASKDVELTCFDIDQRMQQVTADINQTLALKGRTLHQDYLLDTNLENTFDIIVMNPPYIRQELITKQNKENYHLYLSNKLDESIDKKSNLFALFLLKGIIDLVPNGILCAIVFDAVKNSAYGKKTLSILNKHAELISSKTVKTPFENVLIDAQILLYRKRVNPLLKEVESQPLENNNYVELNNLLSTRRGTALPKRQPFLAEASDKYYDYSSPFFIKQSRLEGLVIEPDQRIYLPDTKMELNEEFQAWMKNRLESFDLSLNKRLIKPVRGYIAFNYYIRSAPRHLWNKDNIALSDNFYVSTPNNEFPADAAWLLLNSNQYLNRIVSAARNMGNGLSKLQLYEYKGVMVPNWNLLTPQEIAELSQLAQELIKRGAKYEEVQKIATNFLKKIIHE
ncbi:Eco57I restriction-modification methylase domain-containing protein [Acinetobacter variabilis]|uniref:Eco57I restriction-modification methylase domain-containing protein n=1 Tax=Acinetobacter variabilis TaxID=70346 RepID=UPI003A86CDD3